MNPLVKLILRMDRTVSAAAILVCAAAAPGIAAADGRGQDAGAAPCPGVAPVANWLCIAGGWIPPDHPIAAGAPPSSAPSQAPTPTPSPLPACSIASPVVGWVCVNNGWVPPDHPLAASIASLPPTTPTAPPLPPAPEPAAPPQCDFLQPAPGWVCVNGGWLPPDYPGVQPLQPTGTAVPFAVVATSYWGTWSGFFAPLERFVIRDQAALDMVRTRFALDELESPIDFTQEMLIVVFQGTKPSGGYSIRVDQVLIGTQLSVVVRSQSPGAFCPVTAALTAPLQAIRLPRFDGDVEFFEESFVFECR